MAISDFWEQFIATARRVPHVYHRKGQYHSNLGKHVPKLRREIFYAYQLGPLTAAVAAHAVTNVWEGVPVIPLANSDEIHFAWFLPPNIDTNFPILLRWGLLPDNNTSALTIATTFDRLSLTSEHKASGTAADGATALDDTLAAVVAGDTTASKPFWSQVGVIDGTTTAFEILFLKLVASGQSGADRLRVTCLEIYYSPLY